VKVTPEDVRKLNLPPECINKTPSGETFVKSNLQKVTSYLNKNFCCCWHLFSHEKRVKLVNPNLLLMRMLYNILSGNSTWNSWRTINCSKKSKSRFEGDHLSNCISLQLEVFTIYFYPIAQSLDFQQPRTQTFYCLLQFFMILGSEGSLWEGCSRWSPTGIEGKFTKLQIN
jgi:hypothetical protein